MSAAWLVATAIAVMGTASCGSSHVAGSPTPTGGSVPIVTIPSHLPAPPPTPPRPPEPTTGAVAFKPTAADVAGIVDAYLQFTRYIERTGGGCPVQAVPNTLNAATVTATGISWAFGRLEPQSGCDAHLAYPFAIKTGDTGVFEKQPGGPWVMNYWESDPFPCPDNTAVLYLTPGIDRPYVPDAVVSAVGVHFAKGCDHIFVQSAPR